MIGTAMLWAQLALAAKAPCAEVGLATQLKAYAQAGENAFGQLDRRGFERAASAWREELRCLGEPIAPHTAARVHRAEALAAYLNHAPEEVSAFFLAARVAHPATDLPSSIAPPRHPLRLSFDRSLQDASADRRPLGSLEEGAWLVDGVAADDGTVPVDRPVVLQRLVDGFVMQTSILLPGDDPAHVGRATGYVQELDELTERARLRHTAVKRTQEEAEEAWILLQRMLLQSDPAVHGALDSFINRYEDTSVEVHGERIAVEIPQVEEARNALEGQWAVAAHLLVRATATQGQFAEAAAFRVAYELAERGRPNEAAVAFDAFEAEFPSSAHLRHAAFNAAFYWNEAKRPIQAVERYIRFLDRWPRSERADWVRVRLGTMFASTAEYDDALYYFDQAIELSPGSTTARQALLSAADLRALIGQHRLAAADFERYAAQFPGASDAAQVWYRAGAQFERVSLLEAIGFYERFVFEVGGRSLYGLKANARLEVLRSGEPFTMVPVDRAERSFLVSTEEVSQHTWTSVMGSNPAAQGVFSMNGPNGACDRYGVGPDLPVHCIDWFTAVGFCNRLSQSMGLQTAYRISHDGQVDWDRNADGYRLLTLEEWNFLANQRELSCRTDNLADRSLKGGGKDRLSCRDGHQGVAAVDAMEADHSGLFNLVGNVSEWLWDGQDGAANRNFVGGSYQDGPASYSSPRAVAAQGYRRPSIGLRIARGL